MAPEASHGCRKVLRDAFRLVRLHFRERLTGQTLGGVEPPVHSCLQRAMTAGPPADSELALEALFFLDGPVEPGPVAQSQHAHDQPVPPVGLLRVVQLQTQPGEQHRPQGALGRTRQLQASSSNRTTSASTTPAAMKKVANPRAALAQRSESPEPRASSAARWKTARQRERSARPI